MNVGSHLQLFPSFLTCFCGSRWSLSHLDSILIEVSSVAQNVALGVPWAAVKSERWNLKKEKRYASVRTHRKSAGWDGVLLNYHAIYICLFWFSMIFFTTVLWSGVPYESTWQIFFKMLMGLRFKPKSSWNKIMCNMDTSFVRKLPPTGALYMCKAPFVSRPY